MFYTLGETLASLCNNIIANGLSSILRIWIFFFFHPDKWSEWMIRRKYVLGWIFSASSPDPCLTLCFLLQCSRGWLMDVSTGFRHPLASGWVQPMEDASGIWEKEGEWCQCIACPALCLLCCTGLTTVLWPRSPSALWSGSCSVFCLWGPGRVIPAISNPGHCIFPYCIP